MNLELPPTALLAANDVLAIGALKACTDLGVDVPGQLALIGVDNTPAADVAWPGLTTMDVRPAEVAIRLVDVLIGRIAGTLTSPAVRDVFKPILVPRAST